MFDNPLSLSLEPLRGLRNAEHAFGNFPAQPFPKRRQRLDIPITPVVLLDLVPDPIRFRVTAVVGFGLDRDAQD